MTNQDQRTGNAYTRADARRGGELVDVTAAAREVGLGCPVALTRAAWEGCVVWTDDDTARQNTLQDQAVRLHDVLVMTRYAVQRTPGDRALVTLDCLVPRDGDSQAPTEMELLAVRGHGDGAEPVITVMYPHED